MRFHLRAAVHVLDPVRPLFGPFEVTGCHYDSRAMRGELSRNLESNAVTCPCNYRHLIAQVGNMGCCPVLLHLHSFMLKCVSSGVVKPMPILETCRWHPTNTHTEKWSVSHYIGLSASLP